MKKNGDSKTKEIAKLLKLSEARTSVILKELITDGQLAASGGTKNKTYFYRKDQNHGI